MGRIILPNYPHHVVQRGHDRQVVGDSITGLGLLIKALAARARKIILSPFITSYKQLNLKNIFRGNLRTCPLSGTLCITDMNNRYSAFEVVIMSGFVLIIAAMTVTILIKSTEPFDLLFSLGMWVIVSFFILVFVHGTIRGVPRKKIKIPKGLAVLAFSVSGVLFFAAWLVITT
jgi:hypothetical protein